MRKKSTKLLAVLLAGAMLLCFAAPAALADGAGGVETAETAQTETAHGSCTRRGGRGHGKHESGAVGGTEGETHSHGKRAKPEEPEAPENAIGKDAAKDIALADAGLTAERIERLRARLSDRNGMLVYKVSFKYDGQKYSYRIDPVSGDVLERTVAEAVAHAGRGDRRPAESADPTSAENGG